MFDICCLIQDCKLIEIFPAPSAKIVSINLILSIPKVSSVKTQLTYCQLKWRNVSTQGVIIRPIIEPCMRYIKWKCTFLDPKNVHFHLMYLIHGSIIGLMMTPWVQTCRHFDNKFVVFWLNSLLEYLVKTHWDGSNKKNLILTIRHWTV